MLCVASDAPGSDRIGFVSAHAYTSGALAAELLAHKLFRKAHVATITGELTTLDHAEKLRGFAATLAMLAPHLSLLPAVESHERMSIEIKLEEYEQFLKTLGCRIKQLRNECGYSLRDMVIRFGYNDSQWRRYERGGSINVQSLLKIVRFLESRYRNSWMDWASIRSSQCRKSRRGSRFRSESSPPVPESSGDRGTT